MSPIPPNQIEETDSYVKSSSKQNYVNKSCHKYGYKFSDIRYCMISNAWTRVLETPPNVKVQKKKKKSTQKLFNKQNRIHPSV